MATTTNMTYLLICMIAIGVLYGLPIMEKLEDGASAEEALRHRLEVVTDVGAGDAVIPENAREKMSDVASDGATNVAAKAAGSAYGTAKEKLGEAKAELLKAYETAKRTMTEDAKTMYEAAKEKVSQATGDLGEKMMNKNEEL